MENIEIFELLDLLLMEARRRSEQELLSQMELFAVRHALDIVRMLLAGS